MKYKTIIIRIMVATLILAMGSIMFYLDKQGVDLRYTISEFIILGKYHARLPKPSLFVSALNRKNDLEKTCKFSHEGWANTVEKYDHSEWVGENLAKNYTNPQEAMDAWINSPLHKANMDDKKFKWVGIIAYKSKCNGSVWVVVNYSS